MKRKMPAHMSGAMSKRELDLLKEDEKDVIVLK